MFMKRWVEFTLDIGCPNNCDYCPQDVLMTHYFEKDKHRKSSMTLEDFKRIATNIPKEIDIAFAGFGEPFINADALDMVEHVARKGHDIYIFTTLRGVTPDHILRLKKLPIALYTIHLPDRDNSLKLNVDDSYLKVIHMFDTIITDPIYYAVIGRANEEIKKLLKSTIHETKITSRAVNLDRSTISKYIEFEYDHNIKLGKDKKIICGRRFNNKQTDIRPTCAEVSIVLPDGTVVPCCMDWGLKHPLGNLNTQQYDTIMNGSAMKRLEDAMMCKNDDDIICRNCEWAVEWDEKKWNNFKKTGRYDVQPFHRMLLKRIFSMVQYIKK